MIDKDAYDLSLDELAEVLADFAPKEKKQPTSAEEERVIAGFQDIQEFYETFRRLPATGAEDIMERLLAIRLLVIKDTPKFVELLQSYDTDQLLQKEVPNKVDVDDMNEDELADILESEGEDDMFDLKHVRSFDERNQPDSIAERKPCKDFEIYRHLFEAVNLDLQQGIRRYYTWEEGKNRAIEKNQFYVLNGQIAYIADLGEEFQNAQNRTNSRMRVIYSNGTESDILMRSFERGIYKDPNARGITDPDFGALFKNNGTIYVLRSKSDDPIIAEHRNIIHKIGFTTTTVEARIASAVNDATYLLSEVEVVATYDVYGIDPEKLERLIHKVFDNVRLNIEIKDRFGKVVKPREWFIVPLSVIEELIELIQRGEASGVYYDPTKAELVKASE